MPSTEGNTGTGTQQPTVVRHLTQEDLALLTPPDDPLSSANQKLTISLNELTPRTLDALSVHAFEEPVHLALEGSIDDFWPLSDALEKLENNDAISVRLSVNDTHLTTPIEYHHPSTIATSNAGRTACIDWEELKKEVLRCTFKGDLTNSTVESARQLLNYAPTTRAIRSKGATALVVCNAYPSDEQIYRNGFIHSRVRRYIDADLDVEVFYLHPPAAEPYQYEYDGVRVHVGDKRAYEVFLTQTFHDVYLLHFANKDMVEPLQETHRRSPKIVWIHGFEAEAWHRRWFNFTSGSTEIREALKKKSGYYSDQREFNRQLYTNEDGNFRFVNVSRWFKESIVEPDSGIALANDEVIPNLIDTDTYSYAPKTAAMRYKVLTIRPYASYKYANDITARAIEECSRRPWFDQFSFTVCGSGPQFDEIARPLNRFDNVTLINKFLNKHEIKRMHDTHGTYLTPTRFDSQGVSACEAMSSGLVPLSTDIAAIPEFLTHEDSALLAQPERPNDFVAFLERLHYDPSFYQTLTVGAAKQARHVAGPEKTIALELGLIEAAVEAPR